MQSSNERLLWLLERYAHRTATESERKELTDELAAGAGREAMNTLLTQLPEQYGNRSGQEEPAWDQLYDKIIVGRNRWAEVQVKTVTRSLVHRLRWSVAALMVILLGSGIYFWSVNKNRKETSFTDTTVKIDIAPGKNGAILTLADGSQVLLDTIQNGIVALQGGTTAKVINGTLLYEGRGAAIAYNTITTPKGRQYQLILPDGSKVWLNAASSIKYPIVFNGKERRVEVTGEAYFEIEKNANKPFKVYGGDQEIEVLGTSFNVNACDNEPFKTSLVEGSVKVNQLILKPGQAYLNGKLTTTNIEQDIAWKNGIFDFTDADIQSVMRQLEKWYDIEVVYEDDIPNITLAGKMTKDVTLTGLMNVLKELGVQYRLEGRKLIILPI